VYPANKKPAAGGFFVGIAVAEETPIGNKMKTIKKYFFVYASEICTIYLRLATPSAAEQEKSLV
jgi:hypothetical protein